MLIQEASVATVSEIRIDPQPSGLRAVYLVETRSADEASEIDALFAEIGSQVQIRQLCAGKLVSYVVQAHESEPSILDELDLILRENYAFVVTQRSFDQLIYRIVTELCHDTGSELVPLPHCNICGKIEPFPNTVVSLSDDGGSVLTSRSYCASCTARAAAPSNKEFVRSLLAADERDFSKLKEAELVRHSSRKRPLRYMIR